MDIKKTSLITISLLFTACQAKNDDKLLKELGELKASIASLDAKVSRLGAAGQARPERKRPVAGQLYQVPVHADDSFRGAQHAKVTIVEASEFACPYCSLLANATHELAKDYAPEDLKLVQKHFIVHPSLATLPAQVACAAGKQGKYSEMADALWASAWSGGDRPKLNRDKLAKDELMTLAGGIGLDAKKLEADMDSCTSIISRNQSEMRRLGVTGTPAVYINGVYYAGPRTKEGLKAAVDKELEKANAALAKGASLATYYEGLVSKGKKTL